MPFLFLLLKTSYNNKMAVRLEISDKFNLKIKYMNIWAQHNIKQITITIRHQLKEKQIQSKSFILLLFLVLFGNSLAL